MFILAPGSTAQSILVLEVMVVELEAPGHSTPAVRKERGGGLLFILFSPFDLVLDHSLCSNIQLAN